MLKPKSDIAVGAQVVVNFQVTPVNGWRGQVLEHDDLGEGLHNWYKVALKDPRDNVTFEIWMTREQIEEVND